MFIITLTFAANRAAAPEHMEAHNAWLKEGFEAGTFLLAGSLKPALGGGILAHDIEREALEAFVARDPFVAQNVVSAEILELAPARADERLAFLLD